MDIPGGLESFLNRILNFILDNHIPFEALSPNVRDFVYWFIAEAEHNDDIPEETIAQRVTRFVIQEGARLIGVPLTLTPPTTPKKNVLKVTEINKFIKRQYHKDQGQGSSTTVVLKLFLIVYHLCVPYCHYVPPCSRKSQCAKYQSIKSLENQN